MCDVFEATHRIEARSQLIGEGLVMDEFVRARGLDRRFIQVLGIQFSAFDPGNLCADQRGTTLEVLGTVRRPATKLLLVPLKRFSMLGVCVGPPWFTPRRARQRGIEMKIRHLRQVQRQRRRRVVPSFGLLRGIDSRRVVACEKPRLQLSDPVVTFDDGTVGVPREALLKRMLRKCIVVERSEFRGLSAHHSHEGEWRGDPVEKTFELPYEPYYLLGLTFYLVERVARGKKKGNERAERQCSEDWITVLFRHLGGTTCRIDPLTKRPCPRNQNRQ
jgi:hypothetical protein